MLPTKDATIDGTTYRMEILGAISGRDVFLRLAKTGLEKPTRESLARMSAEDLRFVCDAFAERCRVFVDDKAAGKANDFPLTAIFDEHFAARYSALLRWILWGTEINRFFDLASGSNPEASADSQSSPPGLAHGSGDSSSVVVRMG